ncbi:MAG TPA: aldo/keto reductase [Chitinophaga sp.]|uniref:aldo/keto reductase n=1 Tax=Chitinophaga sp. TaxID=1869181 RepID=UPI002F95CB7C
MQYRLFGTGTGLRVSGIALGGAMFSNNGGYGAEPAAVREMLETYLAAGGNFIDTSDLYQGGGSEQLIGEYISGRRNELVLATKYTFTHSRSSTIAMLGNSRKAMVQAVDASLKRLRTDYIDLYLAHAADNVTPVEEIMRGFEDLTRSGKIIYGGLSNFPAWRVATAATLADLRNWAPLTCIQLEYSLISRAAERELLPMANGFGLAVLGYSPLGGGVLTGKYRKGGTGRITHIAGKTPDVQYDAILDQLFEIATVTGANAGQVAIAWAAARGVIPVIGPRTTAQLEDNLGAVHVQLTAEHINRLDEVSAIVLGYPHELLAEQQARLAAGQPELTEKPRRVVV